MAGDMIELMRWDRSSLRGRVVTAVVIESGEPGPYALRIEGQRHEIWAEGLRNAMSAADAAPHWSSACESYALRGRR